MTHKHFAVFIRCAARIDEYTHKVATSRVIAVKQTRLAARRLVAQLKRGNFADKGWLRGCNNFFIQGTSLDLLDLIEKGS